MVKIYTPRYVPEESSPLEEKFINYIMKKGKKSTARKIFNDTLKLISQKTGGDADKIFKLAIENAKPLMEVKAKRIGGAVYQVPREVPPGRQIALAFRWIMMATRSKRNAPMAKKLAQELIDCSNNTGGAIKKKEDTIKMAQANKAFAHLAKY